MAILVLFTSAIPTYANTFTEKLDETRSSKVEKTFTVSPGYWLDLDTRFTNVTITTEAGINEMEVILITDVSAKTSEEAEKLINKLTGTVKQVGTRIKIKSSISEVVKSTLLDNEVKKVVFKDGTKFKFIKYEFSLKVKIPRHLNVEIVQEFGELYIGHLDGDLILNTDCTTV
ncbi:MAG: hypothetical protein ACI959_001214 [Limisphaerales bacterium]|jgi:hypothetical protein